MFVLTPNERDLGVAAVGDPFFGGLGRSPENSLTRIVLEADRRNGLAARYAVNVTALVAKLHALPAPRRAELGNALADYARLGATAYVAAYRTDLLNIDW